MPIPDSQPTRVRYGVMGYLCSLAFILYIDRICIGQAGTAMKAELGLSNFQWGLVGVAFQIAYAIFEPTTGHWGDRYGSRRVLIRIVLWWSAFTALTGCVWNFSYELLPGVVLNGFLLLLVIRFLFGAGEAGALPNAARVISVLVSAGQARAAAGADQHLRPDRRGRGAGAGRLLHPVAVHRLALGVRDLRQPGRRLGVVLRPLVPRRPGHASAGQRRRAALHPRQPAAARRAGAAAPHEHRHPLAAASSPTPTSGCWASSTPAPRSSRTCCSCGSRPT